MIYRVKRPHYSAWQWFEFVALRIVFPPMIIWDFLKLVANLVIGKKVGGFILQAQKLEFLPFTIENCQQYNQAEIDNKPEAERVTFHKHMIVTHDGVHLDTLQLSHASQIRRAPQDQHFIIHFVGNGMSYVNQIDAMRHDAESLGRNVIGFDLRGVNQSTGRAKSKNNLVIDGIAQVQRLINQGVQPQHITLKGHSLGAGIATLVAHHFHQQGQRINVFNGRSFSSITNTVIGWFRRHNGSGHLERDPGKKWGTLTKPFLKFALALVKWEINADKAFKAIPAECKEYAVVRSRRERRTADIVDDAVITQYASLHAALKKDHRKEKAKIDRHIHEIDQAIDAQASEAFDNYEGAVPAIPLPLRDLMNTRLRLQQDRRHFKERKLEGNQNNAHMASLSDLTNRFGIDGNRFFNTFVEKADPDIMQMSYAMVQ